MSEFKNTKSKRSRSEDPVYVDSGSDGDSPRADYTTAPSSAYPSAKATPPDEPQDDMEFLPNKKAKWSATAPGGAFAAPGRARVDFDRKRDAFFRAKARLYTAVLPDKNFVSNLLKGRSNATQYKEEVPYRLLEQPPSIVGGTLKSYQLTGLSYLAYMHENGVSCILADEMGLGKTAQTISLFAYLADTYNERGSHIVICPLSVLGAWMTELARWLPSFTVLRFHGPASERSRLKGVCNADTPEIIVTTYEAYFAENTWFKSRRWGCVVLDEGHRIKNSEANVSIALQGIGAQQRIILSGTPLQNNLTELWSLLHWLAPTVFTPPTIRPFKEAFDLSLGLYDQGFLKKSQALLELIMLRRTKEGVKGELSVPRREEMTLYVPLSPAQRFWYLRLLNRVDSMTLSEIFAAPPAKSRMVELDEVKNEESQEVAAGEADMLKNVKQAMASSSSAEGSSWKTMMNLLMQLRKTCNHPYLLPNAESEPFTIEEHIVSASSKLVLLDKMLKDILPTGEKVLVFSGFVRMLDILEDFMNLRGYKYARLDGSTSRPRRALDIKLFQQPGSTHQVFLISTRAGGLGINLTAASTVVLFDQDWNPQVDIQAISRAHRIGQTKTVQVYRLVCQDSVEEQALTRLRKKLYLSAKVMGTMRNATEINTDEAIVAKSEDDAPRMTRGELATILRGGASALAKWSGTDGSDAFSEFKAATFTELKERGKERDSGKDIGIAVAAGEVVGEEELRKLEQEEEDAEKLLLAGREAVKTRVFEGVVHQQSNLEIRDEWDRTMSRASNSRTVMIDGHAVMKDTINCGSWEAVKTITSDPEMVKKLSDAKRKRSTFEHEDFCMVCKDGGDVYQCASCPRSLHGVCSGYTESDLDAMMSYFCPQHNCVSCTRTTQEAGGLLFRCQLCTSSFCDDCLGEADIEAIGDVLPEFLVLGMGRRSQAYFIRCGDCLNELKTNPIFAARVAAETLETEEKMRAAGMA